MLQQYCVSQSFINNNTIYHSSNFCGGDLLRLFNPVVWMTPWGLSNCPPFFFDKQILMFWLLILVSWLVFIFVIFNGGYEATPLQAVRVPLLVGGSIPHQRGRQASSFLLKQGVLTHFTPPSLFDLANHDPAQWVVAFNVGFTICQHQWALT